MFLAITFTFLVICNMQFLTLASLYLLWLPFSATTIHPAGKKILRYQAIPVHEIFKVEKDVALGQCHLSAKTACILNEELVNIIGCYQTSDFTEFSFSKVGYLNES